MLKRNEPAPALDAPIPGQSLTAPVGDRPWQRPAALPTPEQALAGNPPVVGTKCTFGWSGDVSSKKKEDVLQQRTVNYVLRCERAASGCTSIT